MKEKQIEEMRDTLANINGTKGIHILGYYPLAEHLYNAGYRKVEQGEWIDTGDKELDTIYSGYKCSVCGFIICGHSGKYCCECGAKMKGAE